MRMGEGEEYKERGMGRSVRREYGEGGEGGGGGV